jgi:2-keto-4-pentenoate hydratase
MTTLDTTAVIRAADRIRSAVRDHRTVAPVRDLIGADNVTAAYAVQREVTRARVAGGAKIVGRKIGLTSPAVQRQLGVDQPDFGVLFADMDVSTMDEVPSARLIQPKAEAEIAFILDRDLTDVEVDATAVRAAVAYAVAALEIVDSRIAAWDIALADTVADNASSGLFVLGTRRLTLNQFEPRDVTMRLHADGLLVSQGNGAACLGDPLNALAWLARTAVAFGEPLRAGQVILSGALGPMVPTTPGVSVRADITALGEVTATFSAKEE